MTAGDEPFGSTTDRGYGERRRRRCTLRLAANGLAVAPDFFRYSNKLLHICKIVSMFLLEFFVSVGSSKTLHGLSYFVNCSSVFSMPL